MSIRIYFVKIRPFEVREERKNVTLQTNESLHDSKRM